MSARGYPDVRVLQVAVHERWLVEDDAAPAMIDELRRTRFWPRLSTTGRPALTVNQIESVVHAAAMALVEQARHGNHTPAHPLWSSYLRLLARKALIEVFA